MCRDDVVNPRSALVAALAINIAAALIPFRFDPPRYVSNRLHRTENNVLVLGLPSVALSRNRVSWIDEAARLDTLTVRLRVKSDRASQFGPARIFTNSIDFNRRNLMVGQEGKDLVVRVRRIGSTPNGEPAFVIRDTLQPGRWRDVKVAIRPGLVRITVDGKVKIDQALPADALAGWNRSFGLALGNEVIGYRPWTGEIAKAEVAIGSHRDNLLAPGRLVVPDGWWYLPQRLRSVMRVNTPIDGVIALLHILGFVPVGFFAARIHSYQLDRLAVLSSVCLLSLSVELVKVAVAGRHPSLLNFGAQVVGGLAGVWISMVRDRWMRRSGSS